MDCEVGQSFDSDKDGSLEFDEFVQMRLEWVPRLQTSSRVAHVACIMLRNCFFNVFGRHVCVHAVGIAWLCIEHRLLANRW